MIPEVEARVTATETRVMEIVDSVSGVSNLVRAANFIGTAGVWEVAPSDVVSVDWVDGRSVLAARISEVNHGDCYGWGITNRFAVDVRLTYEVRIDADSARVHTCLSCDMRCCRVSECCNGSVSCVRCAARE